MTRFFLVAILDNYVEGWHKMVKALAAIDSNFRAIFRPDKEPRAQFYSRYRHCIPKQVCVDNKNHIRFTHSCFPRYQDGAQQFNLLPAIGHVWHKISLWFCHFRKNKNIACPQFIILYWHHKLRATCKTRAERI